MNRTTKSMEKTLILWTILLLMVCAGAADAFAGFDVQLSSAVIAQGDLGLIRVRMSAEETPQVRWMNKDVPLARQNGTDWVGFLGVDLKAEPGPYRVAVRALPSGLERDLKIKVVERDYGVRNLTLPKKMVDLDPETLSRAKKEAKIMKALWRAPARVPRWRGAFLKPVPGDVVGPFGRRSVINKQPRSPHSGVDLRGEKGTAVRAINHGKVVFTGDHFFSGLSLVIDHGGGIQSMYFHLDKITVKEEQVVEKGDVIGQVGSTGRATGPHLHWGIRINGARVDPLRLTVVSRQLEESWPERNSMK